MKYSLLSVILFLISTISVAAGDKLKVVSLETTNDSTAIEHQRLDINKELCALLIVKSPDAISKVEGNYIPDEHGNTVMHHDGETWIYLTVGSTQVRLFPEQHLPLMVNFREYNIRSLKSGVTYQLTLKDDSALDSHQDVENQQLAEDNGNYLILTATPTHAKLYIDDEEQESDGSGMWNIFLSGGQHKYHVEADGYSSETGEVTIGSTRSSVRVELSNTLMLNTSTSGAKTLFTFMGVKFNMVFVEGGQFTMGNTAEQQLNNAKANAPVHPVILTDFLISETEVTQQLWVAVMDYNPSANKGAQRPVENVSYIEIQRFLTKLSMKTGKTFKLPTEAQWEFAARGGRLTKGQVFSGDNHVADVAWYRDNAGSTSHDVSTRQPNELGLYDMSGNVAEICSDWYGNYPTELRTNPFGHIPGPDRARVMRGGSFDSTSLDCQTATRNSCGVNNNNPRTGFRIIIAVK